VDLRDQGRRHRAGINAAGRRTGNSTFPSILFMPRTGFVNCAVGPKQQIFCRKTPKDWR
jgi:hypothetical protein